LSTINPTWPDPGSNPCRRGGKPATNRLSYGTAWCWSFLRPYSSLRSASHMQVSSAKGAR
jgi:hypothetical protein